MARTEFLRMVFKKYELPECIDKIKEIISYYKSFESEKDELFISKLKEEIYEMITDGTLDSKIEIEVKKYGKENLIKSILKKLVIKEAEPLTHLILLQFSDDDLIKNAIEILKETDLENESEAVLRFLEMKKKLMSPYIQDFFDTKDTNLIMKGIKIAGMINTNEMKGKLEEFLRSHNLLIQREALLTLIKINDDDALDIVKRNFFHLMGKEQIEALRFINEKKDREFIRKLKEMEEMKLNKELYSLIEKYDSGY